ncbi:MAG: Hsp20/alpha crystallin family protein [Gammaproteobacteria bacterium]|nr:heat-shock protein [Chromatiales bacterium]MDP6674087.1 Hsp20/alpha crystallin family protein [Gammaproteobacteria bacterium]
MTLVSWSPLREFEDLFSRYGSVPTRRSTSGNDHEVATWRPVANISETEKEYLIKAELPEVSRDDVEVSINDGVITIKGERRMENTEENETQHRIESFYGSFARSFSLPADVDENTIQAESKDGVLKVHLPKTEVVRPKAIEIKVA